MSSPFTPLPRDEILALRSSKIREVANAGMGRDNLLTFWFGEPDEPTPEFIRQAARNSLDRGETFYSHNLGLRPLRESLSRYLTQLHGRAIPVDALAITNSGVNALMLAAQALISPGDDVVCVTPLWPNLVEIPKILNARTICVPLQFGQTGWALDIERLLAKLTAKVKVLLINSPNNPTGWTLQNDHRAIILNHCRKHGIWVLSDDAYERLIYDGAGNSSSFLSIAYAEDRVISANTFSKSWLMTGWRLGWLAAPTRFVDHLGKLIEFNTSCAPVFVQRAGIAALEHGQPVIARTLDRYHTARDMLCAGLNRMPGILAPPAPGAMYAFFRCEPAKDSLAFCKMLVKDFGLGLAPGAAFGDEGEGFVRWCFASDTARIEDGLARFSRALGC